MGKKIASPHHKNQPASEVHSSTGDDCKVLLEHLYIGPVTTLYVHNLLGVMSPAVRAMELRRNEYKIITNMLYERDVTGRSHKVAEHVMLRD